jgi:hypothetical protein
MPVLSFTFSINRWQIFLIIMLFTAEVLHAQETYTWKNVAIGGGGFVTGIITSKTEQNLVYARTDVGGAYRWKESEQRWISLLDWVSEDELGFLGVESIAIDPVETNKVYMLVGTSYFNSGKTAVLRSDDYGSTFAVVDVTSKFKAHGNGMGRQSGEKLVVDPNKTNVLFCGTRANGLFQSNDAGSNWIKVSGLSVTTTSNGNGVSFVVLDPSTGSLGSATQTIIAGVSQTGTNLYRSDNGGASFTPITGAPTALTPHRAVLTSNRDLYITYVNNAGPWDISGAGQIWKYNLSSGAWTNVTPSGFAGAYGGISVDPANASRIVASSLNSYVAQNGSWGDRIFLTTNGGANWVDVVNRGFQLDDNGIDWINGHAIHWAGCIEFDPFNSKKAWVISGNGVFKTDDIDATTNIWRFEVKGIEETVPLDIVSMPNGPLMTGIGDYDGFRHMNADTYSAIHTPRMGTTTSIAVASLNPNVMLRVGDKGYYSLDKGLTWAECSVKGVKGSVAISADGKVFFHCPEGSSVVYRSTDNGTSWAAISGVSISNARPVADHTNINKIYLYNSVTGAMLISINKGASFASTGSPGTNGSKIIRLTPGKEGDLWVALYGNGLTRSTNSGQSFAKLSAVSYCGAIGFGKEAPGKTFPAVYIWGTVSGVRGIHRSDDEGVTWKRVNDDAHEYGGPANGQFVIGDMNVYGRVYMSTAGLGLVYGESSETCIPDFVNTKMKLNGVANSTSYINAAVHDDVVITAETSPGTWTWTGPDGFSASDPEISLIDITNSQSGIYNLSFTNLAGCTSALQRFTIHMATPVQVQSIDVIGNGNVSAINTKGGVLQMTATVLPSDAGNKNVIWSLSGGGTLATISEAGLLAAVADGIVTVRATAMDGSGVFDELAITVSNQNITDVEEDAVSQFGIHPNPVESRLYIMNAQSIRSLTLTDLHGRVVYAQDNLDGEISLDVRAYGDGLYILQMQNNKGKVFVKRIVKK